MQRETLSMDRGWRFHEGEVEYQRYNWHDILYMILKTLNSDLIQ